MKKIINWVLVSLSILVFNNPVSAANFDGIYIFGDSLSDSGAFVGNIDAGAGGKFTTNPGPVWTELVGEFYGLDVIANNPNNPRTSPTGNNFAQGGAQVTNPIGIGQTVSPQNALPISTQIANYLAATPSANPNGLYTVWGGANDVFFNAGLVGGGLDLPSAINNMVTSAMSLAGLVQNLSDAGAGTILVPNLPNIGATPTSILQAISTVGAGNPNLVTALNTATFVLRTPANSPADQAAVQDAAIAAAEAALTVPAGTLTPIVDQTGALLTGLSAAFNASLQGFLGASTANIVQLDIQTLFSDALADPSAFGLANVTAPACNIPTSLACSAAFFASVDAPDNFLFADSVHPTTRGHSIIADFAISKVEAATDVPEPSVLFLLGPAFGILALRKRIAS